MKLFTEEQVKKAIILARSSQNYFSTPFVYDEHEVFEKLKPIELPSDEEIYARAFQQWGDYSKTSHQNTYSEGAKWMRDKIQGDNK